MKAKASGEPSHSIRKSGRARLPWPSIKKANSAKIHRVNSGQRKQYSSRLFYHHSTVDVLLAVCGTMQCAFAGS